MSEPQPQPPHVCAVCRRVLDFERPRREVGSTQGRWIHGQDRDRGHAPQPIPLEEALAQPEGVKFRCDFCNEDDPTWSVPVRSFMSEEATSSDFRFRRAMSVDNWLACEGCATLIRRNEWNNLLRRVLSSWRRRHGSPMTAAQERRLRTTYRELRKNMTGAPSRLDVT